MSSEPIRVLVVDDSSVVRMGIQRGLEAYSDIKVVGAAPNPFIARDMLGTLSPDVILLDIEMPRMDGLSFLRRIMRYQPIPTIIVSSLTEKGGQLAMACLQAGAVEVLCKPGAAYTLGGMVRDLAAVIRVASHVKPKRIVNSRPSSGTLSVGGQLKTTNKVIAIGASTGGTVALRQVLGSLPRQVPGLVIVQHMPEAFTKSFAKGLDESCTISVREACDGDRVSPGTALIAPGNHHLQLARDGAQYMVRVSQGPRVNHHRPSVGVLFDSVAKTAGANAMGIQMTGMGTDGAEGLHRMQAAGAWTVAQDEATSVVFGMPREAIKIGAQREILPLEQIAQSILDFARGATARTTREGRKRA